MQTIVILETDYETTEEAIAERNTQAAHLTQQGISFTQQTLFRATDGARVFLLSPIEPEENLSTPRSGTRKTSRSASASSQSQKRPRRQRITYR
ncbi:MAG: hypothetical protein AAF329_12290 [Cyanobacteria bacterium P01_A01_bin.17]